MPHAEDGLVQIGRIVDDNGILAAHLADDLLDERLALGRFAGRAENTEPDLLRSGEGDHGHLRIVDQQVADGAAGAGEELQHVGRQARLPQNLAHRPGDAAGLRRRLDHGRIAGGHAAVVMPQQIDRGKFQGLMMAATPRGSYHCSFSSPTNWPSRCGRNKPTAERA